MSPEQPAVIRDVVLDVAVQPLAVHRIEGRRITMAPGVAPGAHTHNGPVVGQVVEGSVLFQVADEPSTVLRPGDAFFEPADVPITHFDALDDGVVFLAWFPLAEGQQAELTLLD